MNTPLSDELRIKLYGDTFASKDDEFYKLASRLERDRDDLLKALELVLSRALSLDPFTEQQARAAIRKARGEG